MLLVATHATFLDCSCVTSTFNCIDIATIFDENWYSLNGNPLELYFFEDENLLGNELCDSFLGDGICNSDFNQPEYGYDEGDCCAATCNAAHCGIGTMRTSFGINITSGDGYPHCIDPVMRPITIKLNHVTHEDDSSYTNVPPQDPGLMLDCNEKTFFAVNIVRDMANGTNTVMVPGGVV